MARRQRHWAPSRVESTKAKHTCAICSATRKSERYSSLQQPQHTTPEPLLCMMNSIMDGFRGSLGDSLHQKLHSDPPAVHYGTPSTSTTTTPTTAPNTASFVASSAAATHRVFGREVSLISVAFSDRNSTSMSRIWGRAHHRPRVKSAHRDWNLMLHVEGQKDGALASWCLSALLV